MALGEGGLTGFDGFGSGMLPQVQWKTISLTVDMFRVPCFCDVFQIWLERLAASGDLRFAAEPITANYQAELVGDLSLERTSNIIKL